MRKVTGKQSQYPTTKKKKKKEKEQKTKKLTKKSEYSYFISSYGDFECEMVCETTENIDKFNWLIDRSICLTYFTSIFIVELKKKVGK